MTTNDQTTSPPEAGDRPRRGGPGRGRRRPWSRGVRRGAKAMGRTGRRAHGHLEVLFGGPERTRVIFALAGVLALSSADAATVGAAATALRHALRIDNTDIGLLVTVSSLVAAVASVPFGVLADRVRRTRTLGLTVLLWGAAMLWGATTTSFAELLLARLFLGVVTASAGPIVASMVGDYFPGSERGTIYSYILTGELVGAGIGFAITGDVAALSWRAAFAILAVPTFFLARWLFRLPEPVRGGGAPLPKLDLAEPEGEETATVDTSTGRTWVRALSDDDLAAGERAAGAGGSPFPWSGEEEPLLGERAALPSGPDGDGDSSRENATSGHETDAQRLARERGVQPDPDLILRRNPSAMGVLSAAKYLFRIRTNVILILASACAYFYLSGLQTFASEFAHEQYSIPTAVANVLILIVGVGAVVGVLVGGGLGDRLLRRGYLNSRILIAGIAALVTALLFVPAILTRNAVTALPYLTLAAFALMAQNAPIDAARLDIVPPLLWGRAEGIRTLLRTLAQALAPVLFGFVADVIGGGRVGMRWTFLIMLVPFLANGVILLTALKTYPRDVATASAAAPAPPPRGRERKRGRDSGRDSGRGSRRRFGRGSGRSRPRGG